MSADVPAWARDAVFYQVFPDRFASSPRVTDPGPMEPWAATPTVHGFKGGDLLGIVERMGELVDLGVTALYLNPIFTAASNHRYNASDLMAVDPLLGGEPALRELLDVAHRNGIRVILDGVLNHVGRGFWPFQHVVEAGGQSPYRDWFYLDHDVLEGRRGVQHQDYLCPEGGPRGYRSWWDVPALPKLRIEHPAVREYLLTAVEYWTRLGIDGWRLDVPEDIEDPTFWPEFRRRVRAINPEAYLLGEIWHEAPEWLTGDRFDALMNYPLTLAILGFVGGPRIARDVIVGQSNYRDGLVELDAAAFAAQLTRNMTLNPPEATAVQFNLLGSHDSPRARSVLGEEMDLVRLAATLQLTLPGTPSIYYGDEIGMSGGPDPDCRRAYPQRLEDVDAAGLAHREFVRDMIRARRTEPALRLGTVRVVATNGRAVAIERRSDDRRALVLVNAGDEPAALDLGDGAADGLHRLDEVSTGSVALEERGATAPMGPRSAVVLID
ncbi:MAG: glycoside hydrolase family 13 protein [Candidatus Limnocylindrales bacterium]